MTYADIRLVYWAGGNPFHHHQDLNRLRRAFARPETLIVHESVWTGTARHADIVLPATTTLEREDIGKGGIVRDPALHDRAVEKIRAFVTEELGREWKGLIDSPITGTDGNREFLAWLG